MQTFCKNYAMKLKTKGVECLATEIIFSTIILLLQICSSMVQIAYPTIFATQETNKCDLRNLILHTAQISLQEITVCSPN